jgi:hypothetical protein
VTAALPATASDAVYGDILDPVERSEVEESSAFGAAMIPQSALIISMQNIRSPAQPYQLMPKCPENP